MKLLLLMIIRCHRGQHEGVLADDVAVRDALAALLYTYTCSLYT